MQHVGNTYVFDIDDTILTTQDQPIMCIKKLYEKISKDVKNKIFFITARPETVENARYTLDQLNKLGFSKFDGLIMLSQKRSDGFHDEFLSSFKTNARKRIERKYKCKITATIGNSWSDVACPKELKQLPTHIEDTCVIFRHPGSQCIGFKLPKKL
jgi:hypothetical protein